MCKRNDERVLPQGTAYVTDVGMVGPRDGILGMERKQCCKNLKPAASAIRT